MRTIGVGLLGLGNVGSGLIKLLAENRDAIADRIGTGVEVRRILVREVDKPRLVDVDRRFITADVNDILRDAAIDVVVELVGGEESARDYVLRAIAAGKHVVTANKALLAVHGDEIFEAAERRGVQVLYEASVCGGVPIIRALRDGLASDRITELFGIINGTSNYILSRMADERLPFAEVLAAAQAKGYAEADPALDVDGWDAAHKLCILVSLCFAVRVRPEQLLVEGLRNIAPVDLHFAERFGYVIKPLAIAKDHGDSVEARVHPTMIPKRFLLSSVSGVFNAVYVSSQALGPSMYYGRGAGMMPTAVAVTSDLIEVARDVVGSWGRTDAVATTSGLPLRLHIRDWRDRPIRPPGELSSRYYLRFTVLDRPGALADIATVLGRHRISIGQVVQQDESHEGEPVTLVITTHTALERDMQVALAVLSVLPGCVERPRLVRILDGNG